MKSSFFETIRSVDGEVQNISYHQKRYESVLDSLGLKDFPKLTDYLFPPKKGLYRCRVVYEALNLDVSYHPYTKRDINSLQLFYDDTIEYIQKSTDRSHIDKLFAQRGDGDDILIVKNSLITDTSIANIALFRDGIWYTPASPLLHGTTRQRLLDDGFLLEQDIAVEELESFTKVALMNAMIDFDIIANMTFKH